MPFDYYHRLKPWQQRVYDQSDRVDHITLKSTGECPESIARLRDALAAENRGRTRAASQRIANIVTADLGCGSPKIKVQSVRPSDDEEELHGLYEYGDDERPVITVWMRTASHGRVVAIRTYLRTLLHELCHHLDYEYLGLKDSFHTAGFYKRESSLFNQLCRDVDLPRAGTKPSTAQAKSKSKPTVTRQTDSRSDARSDSRQDDTTSDAPVYIEDNRDWS